MALSGKSMLLKMLIFSVHHPLADIDIPGYFRCQYWLGEKRVKERCTMRVNNDHISGRRETNKSMKMKTSQA